MTEYVSVRSNWLSIDSISLERICDVDIEDRSQSTMMDKQDECHEQVDLRKTTSTDENITHVILRSDQADKPDDPVLILSVIQPDVYQINSVQLLSNARHIEFYHQEYIGSCQGSRVTELDQDPIYESIFEFPQSHNEVTLKCLKLADKTDLILYCLQISLIKSPSTSVPTSFPFDLNRVRSMVDESNLSQNARQFMNNLQQIQEQRRSKPNPSQELNLGHIMTMMTGMQTSSSSNTKHLSSTLKSVLNEQVKSTSNQDHESIKQELNALENRLQMYIDKRFIELQQHIDQRFDHLEEKLTNSNR